MNDLNGVLAIGDEVWAVGDNATVIRRSGGAFSKLKDAFDIKRLEFANVTLDVRKFLETVVVPAAMSIVGISSAGLSTVVAHRAPFLVTSIVVL